VAGADEAVRENVQQKAVQELGGSKGHPLGAIVVGVVAVKKTHEPVPDE